MVLSFNMINLFPELAKQAHINPLPRRQRLAVQFFMNNTGETLSIPFQISRRSFPDDKKYPCRMRVTLRHLAILAILSSPFQMLTLDELDRMIRPVVPQQSHGTLRDSIRLVVWKCAEFEKIGGKNHGTCSY